MKKKYEEINFSAKTLERLAEIGEVIGHFQKRGFKMTLRQLYYQLVAKHIIPNRKQEYKKLSNMLKNARMAGLVDWDIIEDRGRVPIAHSQFLSLKHCLERASKTFRLQDREDTQKIYVELLTEKEALSSVLKPLTMKYHKRLVINKGYTSATAMHEMFKRLKFEQGHGRKIVILYLGDHDPSGLDMDRDIEDRLATFGIKVKPERIGLTMKQIEELDPPPDPAKITDPRAKWYIEEFGDESWEVDALPPDYLTELVEKSIKKYMDMDQYKTVIDEEDRLKAKLKKFAENADDEDDEPEDDDSEKTCEECEGDGTISEDCPKCSEHDNDGQIPCSKCEAEGQIECKGCEGSGETATGKEHKACDGTGYKECSKCEGNGSIDCSKCEGEGTIDKDCPECEGEGVIYPDE